MKTEHNLRKGFADELMKLAKSQANDLFKETKNKKKKKDEKSELGNKWREGSPLSAVHDPRDIAVPYERDGAAAQVGSFSAQSSEASSEHGSLVYS